MRELWILLAATLLTIPATWPLLLNFAELSRLTDRTHDDYIFYWNFSWVYRALFELRTDPLFCTEIFHPHGASLASSPLGFFFCLISLPFQALLGRLEGAVLTLKLIGFLSFPLAVHGTSLFLRAHRVPVWAAFLGGCLFAFVPFNFINLARIHYLSGWLLPYFLWLLTLAGRAGRPRALLGAGVAFAVTGACDASLLPALVFAAGGLWWVLWREGVPPWRGLGRLVVCGAIGGVLLLPLLAPALRADAGEDMAAALEFTDTPDRYQNLFSPDLRGILYYVSPGLHAQWFASDGESEQGSEKRTRKIYQSFRPPPAQPWLRQVAAVATLALGAIGIGWGLRRRFARPFVILAALGFVLALGPYRSWGDAVVRMPYFYLAEVVPGMKAGRYVVSNLRLFHFGLAVVAAAGLARGWRWLQPAGWTVLGLAVIAWCGHPFRYAPLQLDEAHRLMAADPAAGAVLNIPQGLSTREMALGQILHGRPLMDGPIHRYPAEAAAFFHDVPVVRRFLHCGKNRGLERGERTRLADENVRMLREHGVRYVLARPSGRYPGFLDELRQYVVYHEGLRVELALEDVLLIRVDDP